MYDRYDSHKGRYVSYNYQPKGDRFSRGLSPTPRVYKTTRHSDTGHSYKRRVQTNEARSLTVGWVKRFLPAEMKNYLEHHTVYLQADAPILFSRTPPGLAVNFEVTEQHKGRRHWFICVGCERRVGKLFVVQPGRWPAEWGCQRCLGLSYPSQAQHKTLARDMAILEGRVSAGEGEWEGARGRMHKRLQQMERRMGALLSKHW